MHFSTNPEPILALFFIGLLFGLIYQLFERNYTQWVYALLWAGYLGSMFAGLAFAWVGNLEWWAYLLSSLLFPIPYMVGVVCVLSVLAKWQKYTEN